MEGKGLSSARHVEASTQPAIAPLDIEDAAKRLDTTFSAYSQRTVAVIDEFDLIADEAERNKFAELIEVLGDRKSEVKLICTGVASALDELLASRTGN